MVTLKIYVGQGVFYLILHDIVHTLVKINQVFLLASVSCLALCFVNCQGKNGAEEKSQITSPENQTRVNNSDAATASGVARDKILEALDAEQKGKELLANAAGIKEVNLAKERTYFEQLKADAEVKPLGEGIYYKVFAKGSGEQVARGVYATFEYQGRLLDGKVFVDRIEKMIPVGYDFLIPGLDRAFLSMRVGDDWEVYIPSAQGYAESSNDNIPAYSTLIYRIKLQSVYRQ